MELSRLFATGEAEWSEFRLTTARGLAASLERRTLPARRYAQLKVFLKRQSCLKNGFWFVFRLARRKIRGRFARRGKCLQSRQKGGGISPSELP